MKQTKDINATITRHTHIKICKNHCGNECSQLTFLVDKNDEDSGFHGYCNFYKKDLLTDNENSRVKQARCDDCIKENEFDDRCYGFDERKGL